MKETTHKDRAEVLTWLGWVVASPIAALTMVLFLLSACASVDLCPDRQCEYGYAEASGEAPEPGDKGDKGDKGDTGKGEKGDRDNDKGRDSEKGESDDGRERSGKDKGVESDND